jgi:hypothetical protein
MGNKTFSNTELWSKGRSWHLRSKIIATASGHPPAILQSMSSKLTRIWHRSLAIAATGFSCLQPLPRKMGMSASILGQSWDNPGTMTVHA